MLARRCAARDLWSGALSACAVQRNPFLRRMQYVLGLRGRHTLSAHATRYLCSAPQTLPSRTSRGSILSLSPPSPHCPPISSAPPLLPPVFLPPPPLTSLTNGANERYTDIPPALARTNHRRTAGARDAEGGGEAARGSEARGVPRYAGVRFLLPFFRGALTVFLSRSSFHPRSYDHSVPALAAIDYTHDCRHRRPLCARSARPDEDTFIDPRPRPHDPTARSPSSSPASVLSRACAPAPSASVAAPSHPISVIFHPSPAVRPARADTATSPPRSSSLVSTSFAVPPPSYRRPLSPIPFRSRSRPRPRHLPPRCTSGAHPRILIRRSHPPAISALPLFAFLAPLSIRRRLLRILRSPPSSARALLRPRASSPSSSYPARSLPHHLPPTSSLPV